MSSIKKFIGFNFFSAAKVLPFPTNYYFENSDHVNLTATAKSVEDLHIFVPGDFFSVPRILDPMIKARTRTDQEFWLIDISLWDSISSAVEDLKMLNVDIDDDIFLYTIDEGSGAVKIWEIYRISPKQEHLDVLFYNDWLPSEIGFQDRILDKWVRRRNLGVLNI